MMVVLLVAGIGLLLAGLVAIGFGIPINEFSFGNTLISPVRWPLAPGCCCSASGPRYGVEEDCAAAGPVPPRNPPRKPGATGRQAARRAQAAENSGFRSAATSRERKKPAVRNRARGHPPPSPPPWRARPCRASARRTTALCAGAAEPAPAAKPRRNLLFSSSSRKERERAQARIRSFHGRSSFRAGGSSAGSRNSRGAARVVRGCLAEVGTFADADSAAARAPPDAVDFDRKHPAAASADRYPPAVRNEEPAQVTVLKSGVVDGMAYSLYSDGSIEAQMPEGMMRFASIDELRAHLDQRP